MSENPWALNPQHDHQIWCPTELDLSGGLVSVPFFASKNLIQAKGNVNSTVSAVIKNMIIMYTEATDAANTNNIRLGNEVNDFYHTSFSTPSGKAIGDVDIVDQVDFDAETRIFNTFNWVQVTVTAGSTGAGKVRVGMTLSYSFDAWKDFTP